MALQNLLGTCRQQLFLMLLAAGQAFAQEKSPEQKASQIDEEIYLVQTAPENLKWRPFELGFNYGLDTASSYYTSHSLGVELNYYLGRSFFVGLRGSKYFNESTHLMTSLENALDVDLHEIKMDKPDYMAGFQLGVVPLSGLVNMFSAHVVRFDLPMTIGPHYSRFESGESFFGAHFTLKPRISISNRWAISAGPLLNFDRIGKEAFRTRVGIESAVSIRIN